MLHPSSGDYYCGKYECVVASHLKTNQHEDVCLYRGGEEHESEKNQLGNDYSYLNILSGAKQSTKIAIIHFNKKFPSAF